MTKKLLKKVTVSFMCGIVTALTTTAVFAGNAIGPMGYYDCNGYYYMVYNDVTTGSGYAYGTTTVTSQDLSDFPSGYVGIQPFLYDASTKKAVISAPWRYNSSSLNIFSNTTITYATQRGSYYSQGVTRGYHPSDTNAIYYPYHQFSTPASPAQTVS